jgi:alcohol dehydrogenase (cytochrome c)
MAYDGRTLFVPAIDLCMQGSSVGYEQLNHVDIARRARGQLVALDAVSGRPIWVHALPHAVFGCATVADGVVFTSTFDGEIYGLDTRDGTMRWRVGAPAGINSCPALSGDTLLVGAGVPHGGSFAGLIAYRTR